MATPLSRARNTARHFDTSPIPESGAKFRSTTPANPGKLAETGCPAYVFEVATSTRACGWKESHRSSSPPPYPEAPTIPTVILLTLILHAHRNRIPSPVTRHPSVSQQPNDPTTQKAKSRQALPAASFNGGMDTKA